MSRAKVIIEESVVRVVTVGIQGPPGVGISQAYVDAGDAASRARANHTGSQPASTISDFATAVDARVAIQKGVANGLATLGSDNKIPSAQLPAIAITDTFPVASQAAMLALTAEVGDIAVRTDLNKTFILKIAGASTLANWQELLTPTDSVLNVNGRTGAVTGLAEDSAVVHNTGVEAVAGAKTFSSNLTAAAGLNLIGDSVLKDATSATKAYRLRTSGASLDFDAAGADLYFSTYPNADFTGSQIQHLQFNNEFAYAKARKKWIWAADGGADALVIDPNSASRLDLANSRIVNVAEPASAQHAATKNYVDTTAQPLDRRLQLSVRRTTTSFSENLVPGRTGRRRSSRPILL